MYVENIEPTEKIDEKQAVEVSMSPLKQKSEDQIDPNPMFLAWIMIFESIQNSQRNVVIQEKELQANAAAQQGVLNREEAIKPADIQAKTVQQVMVNTPIGHWKTEKINVGGRIITIGPFWVTTNLKHLKMVDCDISNTQIQLKMVRNQGLAAERNELGDKVSLLRQGAQVVETNMSVSIQTITQEISASSSLLSNLVSLGDRISRM